MYRKIRLTDLEELRGLGPFMQCLEELRGLGPFMQFLDNFFSLTADSLDLCALVVERYFLVFRNS